MLGRKTVAQTHAHIRARPDKSVGDRVDELARNAKVADLDLTSGVDEDVGRLDICSSQPWPKRIQNPDIQMQKRDGPGSPR